MIIEASSKTRAVCRECGSAIEPEEPRLIERPVFASGELPRRPRGRHLACAAHSMPEALLRALDHEGWRAVAAADRQPLRAMIEEARARRREGEGAEPGEPQAARSSSAMAAAAVLETAHEAERLSPEHAEAWVFADALQARGDPRGELLALELAAEHTEDPRRARALQREHRACWASFDPPLRASKELRLRWVGGFLRGAMPHSSAAVRRLTSSSATAALERVRVDFCTQEDLEHLVQIQTLRVLELVDARHRELGPLARLPELQRLRVHGRVDTRQLARLPGLRGLSLGPTFELEGSTLRELTGLELLELRRPTPATELAGLGQRHPALQHLCLIPAGPAPSLAFLRGASALRRLQLSSVPLTSLEPLPSLSQLRELELYPGTLALVAELGALPQLERLALVGSKVGELDALAALGACTHLALVGTRTTELGPLRRLPRLRSLTLVGGDMRRIAGLEALTQLEQLELRMLANLDLTVLPTLEQLDTLVLAPGGRRPRGLEALATCPKLRRLGAPLELLRQAPAALLNRLEVLELSDGLLPDQGLLDRLPTLRRLLIPNADPAQLERLAEANPELALFADTGPRDLLDRRDPFDWRDLGWLPSAP